MGPGYHVASEDPYELRANGVSMMTRARLLMVFGAAGVLPTFAFAPALSVGDEELAALPMSGIVLFGVLLMVGAFLAGHTRGSSAVVMAPRRVRIVKERDGTRLEADRRVFLVSDVQRIEFHVVPGPDGRPRFTTTIVVPHQVVELTFDDPEAGAEIAAELHRRLELPQKPIARERPLFRAYGVVPAFIVAVAVFVLLGAGIGVMLNPPRTHFDTWPAALSLLATTLALYFVTRATAASTARKYVQTEYS